MVPKAQAALTRALELDPSMGEAYTTLALVNSEASGKRRALEADLRHAVQLSPNYATAHQWLGLILKGQGRFGEADAELRQAQLLDPLSPMITEGVAENSYYWRRYDDAIVQLDKLQAIGFTASQELRGMAYIQTGRYQQALQLFEDMRQHVSRPTPLLYLAMAHAAAGHREEATRLLNTALEQKNYISAYSVALVYASLGDKNGTIEWLQKAVEQKDPLMANAKMTLCSIRFALNQDILSYSNKLTLLSNIKRASGAWNKGAGGAADNVKR